MIRHYDHLFVRDAIANINPVVTESKNEKTITYQNPTEGYTLVITPTTRKLLITDPDGNMIWYVMTYHKVCKHIRLTTIVDDVETLETKKNFFDTFSRYGIKFTLRGHEVILTLSSLKMGIVLLCNPRETIQAISCDLEEMSNHPVLIYSVNFNGFLLRYDNIIYEIEHLLQEKYSSLIYRADDESGYIRLLINDQWKVAKGTISIGPNLDIIIRPLNEEGAGTYEIVPFGYNHQLGTISYDELTEKLYSLNPHQVWCYFSDRYDHQLVDYLKNTNRDDYVKDSINGMLNFEESEKWVFQKSIHFESFRQIK